MKKTTHRHRVFNTFFVALFFFSASVFAQENDRPKVGLVLSGGGAKGFAHVGVLKVLEEYNIPIDYIGGTSIGSIIGGLYAIGYSASQIEEMILEQDWQALFMDEEERKYLPFYEKDEKERYQIKMQIKNGKLFFPNYAITNNGILRLFSDLTIGYHGVEDFNKLPTPFLCVAVDLQTGKEVLLNSGFLPMAMTASMAIPAIFPSVNIDSMVLVDGGVRNNLPIDYVRELGADIIIGIDVGADMHKKEGLKSFMGIVDQLTTMLADEKFNKNREDCDIYIKPDLEGYASADFTSEAAKVLFERGETVARSMEGELVKLAQQFDGYEFPKREGYKGVNTTKKKRIELFDIHGARLSDDAVLGIMGISKEDDMACDLEDLEDAISKLRASLKFSSIRYKLDTDSLLDYYTLHLYLEESDNNTINFGTNYNNQDNVSLLLNGTFNTLWLKNSRASLDVKLSEVPVFDLRYNINRGSLPGLGVNAGFRRRVMQYYEDKRAPVGEAEITKNYFELNTNTVVNEFLTLGFGVRYEHYIVHKIKRPFPIEKGNYSYLLYRFFLEVDKKDKVYYPKKGISYHLNTFLITDNGYKLNDKIPSLVTHWSMDQTFAVNSFYTITPSMYLQLELVAGNKTPLFYDTYAGGCNRPDDIVTQIPFWGLRWGEFRAKNIAVIGLENRFEVAKKNYFYLNANVLAHTALLTDISKNKMDYKFGMAVGYSYDSLIGPLEIFFSMSNDVRLRTNINIGYYF